MSFAQAVTSVFRKYATFKGRSQRSEFWWFMLFLILFYGILEFIVFGLLFTSNPNVPEGQIGPQSTAYWAGFSIVTLLAAVTLLPTLAVGVRRLQDAGYTGWLYLLSIIPFGGFVLIYFWMQPSSPGFNDYGPNPMDTI